MDISFICMSNKKDKENALRQNLRDIFGSHPEHKYELLVADGTIGDGLCAGYNKMSKIATYDTFVFLHNDITLLCNDKVLEVPYNLCQKMMTGIIGVAGTRVMPKSGKWWDADNENCRGAVHHSNPRSLFGCHLNMWPHQSGKFGRVAVVDGCFMMMSRKAYNRLKGFDEVAFTGFHFYEIDISTRSTLTGLQNYVCPIPILHQSPGVPDNTWEEAKKLYLMKFGNNLPLSVPE